MDPIPIKYATGDESFIYEGSSSQLVLKDFWSWAYSDCINNTTRGVLAEFMVASALGIDLKIPRDAWAKFDLVYRGKGIEIKSCSYHQRWHQERKSLISFQIPPSRAWSAKTNKMDHVSKRQAFLYVLCLLAEQERSCVNPLVIDQWQFWAVPTSFFNNRKRSQHSISYASLLTKIE